jgi:amidophosphoribosyltransferase
VLLVDDSIVRGTTSREIVQMARESGAKKVIFASAAPPVIFPNVYGIDMPTRDELIAFGRSEEEVCREITADALVYQDVEAMKRAIADSTRPCATSRLVLRRHYITGDITQEYLDRIEYARKNPKPALEDAVRSQLNLNLARVD